ncbi:MAG: hypothetical protein J0I70_09715 [Microbacterium sp.]|uniref:hypothetical protein n=1 Tax=Microbacterium sp. TaxID=51671 RepID=UPI00092AE630|nr:hypothetical protein [Microbacterium sp.]MBN9174413.1 hypothetical protein [Microbacterium sp.]MBN9186127.1 hypothetical protein [Microbacterium sp.]MBN9192547.1 hypothetical protein [Microbacterium sp.]OJU57043.1 MAG: hypothetical protein BGO04_09305 [Microbacterium sp. 70-38]
MVFAMPEALVAAILSIFLFLVMCGALVLVVVSLRHPTTLPLIIATGLVVLALAVVIVSPVNVPTIMGLILALLGIALGVVGGNPLTRRILEIATHGRVHETSDGGIRVDATPDDGTAGTVLLRGGTTIGYLERVAAVIGIVAGFPEALAVIVAVKGVGRFSELASAEARERFIIGTLASLLWACVVAALVRLAIW